MSGRRAKASRRAATTSKRNQQREHPLRRGVWPTLAIATVGVMALVYVTRGQDKPKGRVVGSSDYPYQVGSPGTGAVAPPVNLPATSGVRFDLAASRGKEQVLLYFQEGLTCQPCWDQITAIQRDLPKLRALGIDRIASITTDPLKLIAQKARDDGLTLPVLADQGGRVSDSYDARSYGMMGHSRDGHTFVFVGMDGRIRWRADYGGPPKFTMFVPDEELLAQLRQALGSSG